MSSPLGLLKNLGDYFGNTNDAYKPNEKGQYKSITNKGKFYYRPKGDSNVLRKPTGSKPLYKDDKGVGDIYNTSIDSICEWSYRKNGSNDVASGTSLNYADFFYLRDIGVLPNNRLIIARRFASPVHDDLNLVDFTPISKLISWVKEEDSFYNFSFSEEWTDGETSIKNIIDDALGKNMEGGRFGSALNNLSQKFPNGGYMDAFRFELLNSLGYTDLDSTTLPSGNPNLIQESAMRKIPGDEGGSGLKGKFSVEFETTYEQKYIKGLDPSIAYLDILQNILRFGTSEAQFYLRAEKLNTVGNKLGAFFQNIREGRWESAIFSIIEVITKSIKSAINSAVNFIQDFDITNIGADLKNTANFIANTFINGLISKYKIQFMSAISALTGEPSAPWHVTIGNPKKPVFSCGDLVLDGDIDVSFGNTLYYNDLPSTITVKVKLKSARNMGLSELFDKFNPGTGRSYVNAAYDTLLSKDVDTFERTGVGVGFQTTYGTVKDQNDKLEQFDKKAQSEANNTKTKE